MWVALACATLLFAFPAAAAIRPVCDDDAIVSRVPAQPEPACVVVTSVDETTGALSTAPLCDPQGATAVAPPPILAVDDARIEAAPRCGDEGIAPLVGPRRSGDGSAAGAFGPALDPAHLADTPTLSAAALATTLDWLGVTGEALPGYRASVYHPPR